MKKVLFLMMCLGASTTALHADDKIPIETSPGIGRNFKIAPYLSAAKSLQDQGRDKAITRLQSWADSQKHEDQVVILCRMLFEAKNEVEFRRPRIGGAAFIGGTDYPDWPLEPIDIYEGTPILITYGYSLGGVPEPSRSYLDFCVKNGNWRKERYTARTPDELNKIIAKWLTSRKWPSPLSVLDREFFTKQAESAGTNPPTAAPESKPEGKDKPQPEPKTAPR